MKKLSLLIAVILLGVMSSFAGTWEVLCVKQGPARGHANLPKRMLNPQATTPTTAPGPQAFYPIPARSVPSKALVAEQSDNHGPINFISLGFGGQIVMRYSCWIVNVPGNDFTLHETTYGDPSCQSNVSESALVEVSEDGINWMTPGSVLNGVAGQYNACHNQSFDISPMIKVQFVRITDRTNPATNIVGDGNDGYDIDGITVQSEISGISAAVFLNPICDYQQGVASQYVGKAGNYPGRGIVGIRKNFANANINEVGFPQSALTNPSLRDATSGTYNFYSLGFGGWACMQLPYTVFNGPGTEFFVFETTWQNQPCPNYPEKANVSVSVDGVNWSNSVLICKDALSIPGTSNAIDLSDFGPNWNMVNYIKFQDASNPSDFGGGADGYDLDNIIISQMPPPVPGSTPVGFSCDNSINVRISFPNDASSTFIDGGVPEEMYPLEIVGSNMVNEKLEFMATIAEEGGYNYSIRNSQGKLLSEGSMIGNLYETPTQEVSVNNLPNGVYFLTLASNSTKETVRFIKN
jgi:hypothetical protein